jgi:SAM-dependent methyltransferase
MMVWHAALGMAGTGNPSRVHLTDFVRSAAASLPSGARMLDAGAGDCRYRVHFNHVHYESADFLQVDKPYAEVDYVCSLDDIPVEPARYDLVLLTQVLEHVPDPPRVLAELHRVLKPRGRLWLTAPLFYPEHEAPYDFFRYTQFAYHHLLGQTGFDIERLEWLDGYFATASFQFDRAATWLPWRPSSYGSGPSAVLTAAAVMVTRPILRGLAQALARADVQRKHTTTGHPKNYAVIAQKAA